MRRLLVALVAALPLVAAVGCGSSSSDRALKDRQERIEQLSKRLSGIQANQENFPVTGNLQQILKEAQASLQSVRDNASTGGHKFADASNQASDKLEKLETLARAATTARALKSELDKLKSGQTDARILWHLREAEQDLKVWEETSADAKLVSTAKAAVSFVKDLAAGNESWTDSSCVRVRDSLFYEGDIDTHDGDSELVKAHLRQAILCSALTREAMAKATGSSDYVSMLAECELKHVYRLRRGQSAWKPAEDNWREKEVHEPIVLLDRLVALKKRVTEQCPPNSAATAELLKAEELMKTLPRNIAGLTPNGGITAIQRVIDRTEDELLRYKNCGGNKR